MKQNGIYYGLNVDADVSKILIERNEKYIENPLILGKWGGEMTYCAKRDMISDLLDGKDIVVVDPKGELND